MTSSRVVALTDANFDEWTGGTRGVWLVAFTASWCGHCKKLLPLLDELSLVVPGGMNIGKVDATENYELKSRFNVDGYPTVKFLKDGEWHDYRSDRSLESLKAFAARMTGLAVTTLKSASALDVYSRRHNVSFVFAADDDSGTSGEWYGVFARLASENQDIMDFAQVDAAVGHKALKHDAPFLVRMEHGEEPVFADPNVASSSAGMSAWLMDNRFQVYAELATHNFRDTAHSGRLLVVNIVNPSRPSAAKRFHATMRTLARRESTPLPPAVFLLFRFGWLDGVRWSEFVAQFNVDSNTLPRMIVLDSPAKKFYEDPEVDEPDELETFLQDIIAGKVPAQREGLWGYPERAWRWCTAHPIGASVIALVLVAVVLVLRGSPKVDVGAAAHVHTKTS